MVAMFSKSDGNRQTVEEQHEQGFGGEEAVAAYRHRRRRKYQVQRAPMIFMKIVDERGKTTLGPDHRRR
jgi:hypothetical protein